MMSKNNFLNNVLIFAVGAAIGVAASRQFFKSKYERIADEEIASVKERYSQRAESEENLEKLEDGLRKTIDNMQKQIDEYEHERIVQQEGYTNYTGKKAVVNTDRPYIIDAEEYDELEGYEAEELLYYSDGVLADYYGNIVDDVDDMVGLDNLERVGKEDEEDSLHVRNDSRQCDYEILLDLRDYSEVYPNGPRRAEV